ncbi:hypothetical protein Bbelb_209990 [Branchiostoma belcheri]|nr:hypothetical protein Bbelb_209990 [Branchiostoma belcheri]
MNAKKSLLAVALLVVAGVCRGAAETSQALEEPRCFSSDWAVHHFSPDRHVSRNGTGQGLDLPVETSVHGGSEAELSRAVRGYGQDGHSLVTLDDIVAVAKMTERLVEMNPKDQEFAAAVVGKLAGLVRDKLEDGVSSEEVSLAASAVVDAVATLMKEWSPRESRSNLIGTDLTQPDEQIRHQAGVQTRPAIAKEVTLGALLTEVDELSRSLLRGKAEMGYLQVGTKGVRVVVGKSPGADIGGTRLGVNKGTVTLPSVAALFGEKVPDIARLKVVGFEENPFQGPSTSGLGSSVLNVDLYDSTGESIPVQFSRGHIRPVSQRELLTCYLQPGDSQPDVNSETLQNGLSLSNNLPEDIRITVQNNLPAPADATLLRPYSPDGHGPMAFRSFGISGRESYLVTVALKAPSRNATLYGRVGMFPTETEHEFRKVFTADDDFDTVRTTTHGDDGIVYTTSTVVQPDFSHGEGQYMLGLRMEGCTPTPCRYEIKTFRLGCRFWNEQEQLWSGDGCKVSPDSSAKQTVCLCNHMTPFGAEIVTTPNVIKFKTVFAKFVNLKDNLAVFITVFATLGLYIILLLLVRRWDKRDLSKWAVKEIPGSPGSDAQASQYLMTVHTGHDWEAGTRSKVTFTLYGDQYDSGVREMPQNERTFEMAGTDNFLLKTSQPLGDLISLKMSHDNSGEGQYASWHLHKVVITHLDTNKRPTSLMTRPDHLAMRLVRWVRELAAQVRIRRGFESREPGDSSTRPVGVSYVTLQTPLQPFLTGGVPDLCMTTFMCDDWLDEVYSAGKFSRTIHAQSEMDLSFGPTFKTAIRNKFTDGHLWLSVGTRRPRSYFTRVQRLSCCLCLLYCKMIASAMWFRTAGQVASPALFTIGPVDLTFRRPSVTFLGAQTQDTCAAVQCEPVRIALRKITTQQLWISVVTTLQIFPVNFAIVQIFRRCRPKDKASEGVDPAGENPKSAKYQVRKKWRASMMPHWFIYLAWAMLFLASLASAFFLVLYSMEWGNDKSIQWLTTFGLSFGHSMFIVHPGKAVFVVLVMTILCRRRVSQGPGDMMMDELIFTTGGSPEPEHNVPASAVAGVASCRDVTRPGSREEKWRTRWSTGACIKYKAEANRPPPP